MNLNSHGIYSPKQIYHYGYLQRIYSRKWLLNEMSKYISAGSKVLDYGCGSSPHRPYILDLGGIYSGVSHLMMPQYFYRNFLMRHENQWLKFPALALSPLFLVTSGMLNLIGLAVNKIDGSKLFASDIKL